MVQEGKISIERTNMDKCTVSAVIKPAATEKVVVGGIVLCPYSYNVHVVDGNAFEVLHTDGVHQAPSL
jgi:hypothetical protein